MKAPFCLFFSMAIAAPFSALAQASPVDADLLAKKPPFEQTISQIQAERLAFQQDLAQREEACLKLFISSACMEEIRQDYLTRMRAFDQRREQARQALRDIDAELRARDRARRIADHNARQKIPASPAAGEKSKS